MLAVDQCSVAVKNYALYQFLLIVGFGYRLLIGRYRSYRKTVRNPIFFLEFYFDTILIPTSGIQMTEYLLKQLSEYVNLFPGERADMQSVVEQIKSDINILDRKTIPGHITASGIVLSKDCMLMIRHPVLGKWLQPGGHVERDETPLHAAIREVKEETGISVKLHAWHRWNQFPIDISIHMIAANERKSELAHLHYDFRYMLTGSGALGFGEHASAWKNIADIEESKLTGLVKKIHKLKIEES